MNPFLVLDACAARHYIGVLQSSGVTIGGVVCDQYHALIACESWRWHSPPFWSAAIPWRTSRQYLRDSHSYAFRDKYPEVDALFNAFDHGHAVLYEVVLKLPSEIAQCVDME